MVLSPQCRERMFTFQLTALPAIIKLPLSINIPVLKLELGSCHPLLKQHNRALQVTRLLLRLLQPPLQLQPLLLHDCFLTVTIATCVIPITIATSVCATETSTAEIRSATVAAKGGAPSKLLT
jgi:hypothetical protein